MENGSQNFSFGWRTGIDLIIKGNKNNKLLE